MKYITSALVLIALFNIDQTSAIRVRDDLFKDLAKDLAADMDKEEKSAEPTAPVPPKKEEKPVDKKAAPVEKKPTAPAKKATEVKKTESTKKEEDEIPMDNAAIKAYSSVIADAAEDSEPQKPVVYSQTIPDEP